MSLVFPIAFLINSMSISGLIVFFAFAGQPVLAADVGVVHGALVLLFYAFSINARNLILRNPSRELVSSLLISRIILSAPFGIIALYLSIKFTGVHWLVPSILILRRIVEWIFEIYLGLAEYENNKRQAYFYCILQAFLFLVMALTFFMDEKIFHIGLLVWALAPLTTTAGFLLKYVRSNHFDRHVLGYFLPNFGSTATIGMSTYLFRVIIIQVAGKELAGNLFAAFSLGGMVVPLYVNGLGPSLVFRQIKTASNRTLKWLRAMLLPMPLFGLVMALLFEMHLFPTPFLGKPDLFWSAVGLSLVGGFIMFLAQHRRLMLIQTFGDQEVFGHDLIIHFLLLLFVPLSATFLGPPSLRIAFLVNAVFSFSFYNLSPFIRSYFFESEKSLYFTPIIKVILAVALIIPIFFLIDGSIFLNTDPNYSSGGLLRQLPIPLSLFACYAGVFLLGYYQRARESLGYIFFSFSLMLITTILSTKSEGGAQTQKILLLLQFILPAFAMALGQMYDMDQRGKDHLGKIVLVMLALIVPAQLWITLQAGSKYMLGYLYFFSIYQSSQYVPAIFSGLFVLSSFLTWNRPRFRVVVLVMIPVMVTYCIYSGSLLAIFAVECGLLLLAGLAWKTSIRKIGILVLLLLIIGNAIAFPLSMKRGSFLVDKLPTTLTLPGQGTEGQEVVPATPSNPATSSTPDTSNTTNAPDAGSAPDATNLPENIKTRLDIWDYYGRKIVNDYKSFLFGQPKPPDREDYPSAHNYLLDLVYNFGFISALPFFVLLGLTFIRVYRRGRRLFRGDPATFGLAFTVFFLVVLDNAFKVGMRQLYPGIITYFLWGLLLTRISESELLKPTESFPDELP